MAIAAWSCEVGERRPRRSNLSSTSGNRPRSSSTPAMIGPMWSRARWIGAIGIVAAVSVPLAGCSDATDAAQNSSTSTSTTGPRSTTVPTTRVPAAPELPGLWAVSDTGVVDEAGQRFASPVDGSDEVLRSLVDDGSGGVFYLRCPEPLATECAVEHAQEPNGEPRRLGAAVDLLAAGTWGDRPVLAAAVIDPTRAADPAANVGQTLGRLLDVETGESIGTFDWYGWDSGPTAFDIAGGSIVACMGRV